MDPEKLVGLLNGVRFERSPAMAELVGSVNAVAVSGRHMLVAMVSVDEQGDQVPLLEIVDRDDQVAVFRLERIN